VGWKRILGLALASVALLAVWGGVLAPDGDGLDQGRPAAAAPVSPKPKPIEISIDANGAIQINGRPSSLDTLASDVNAVSTTRDKSQQQVMIPASETVKYDTYMAVLERLRGTGWHKVGVINGTIPN